MNYRRGKFCFNTISTVFYGPKQLLLIWVINGMTHIFRTDFWNFKKYVQVSGLQGESLLSPLLPHGKVIYLIILRHFCLGFSESFKNIFESD